MKEMKSMYGYLDANCDNTFKKSSGCKVVDINIFPSDEDLRPTLSISFNLSEDKDDFVSLHIELERFMRQVVRATCEYDEEEWK